MDLIYAVLCAAAWLAPILPVGEPYRDQDGPMTMSGQMEDGMSNGRLPGDATPRAAIARMIRVDHAGEFGAKQIYAGQLAVFGPRAEGRSAAPYGGPGTGASR